MTSLPAALQAELSELALNLEGLERTRYLCIAATCVLLYDLLLTLDEEVKHFWKPGPWSLSRILFFLNRYFPPVVLACIGFVHSNFILAVVGLAIVQAIIVLRICYVYSKELIARLFVISCFVACTIVTFVILGKIWHDIDSVAIPLRGLKINGCTAPPSRQIWKVLIPNLGLHTVLYLATTLPVLKMRLIGKQSRLLNRLAIDGGVFYFNIFAVAMFSTIGSLAKSPLITLPAIYSKYALLLRLFSSSEPSNEYASLLLAIAALSVSRVMLSIRSLATRLSVSPDWLLNNTELSRVNWKPGPRNGELVVEIEPVEDDLELASVDELRKGAHSPTPAIYTTRVGVLNHPVYPGTRDYKAPPRTKKTKVAFRKDEKSSYDV
ncbi:hypothetical protein C8Q79DRAFT_1005841 [Trametes meyenii]|nr:hypothetical protein C8Q79DRAFT_1005841 [Trametes meyenii]